MIDIKELRVGNWVSSLELVQDYENNPNPFDWVHKKIDQVDDLFDYDEYEPIQLTYEVLLKCGFEDKYPKKEICFKIKSNKRVIKLYVKNGSKIYYDFVELKYLHQLQNLFYSLVGEELKIEL